VKESNSCGPQPRRRAALWIGAALGKSTASGDEPLFWPLEEGLALSRRRQRVEPLR
jgi:hypothetical protein